MVLSRRQCEHSHEHLLGYFNHRRVDFLWWVAFRRRGSHATAYAGFDFNVVGIRHQICGRSCGGSRRHVNGVTTIKNLHQLA